MIYYEYMSILITGVTGTLGTILAEYFLKKKKKVFGCSKKISSQTKKKFESFNTNNELFFYNSIDIRKVTEIKKWYKDVKGKTNSIEIIINCAAISGEVNSFFKITNQVWKDIYDTNFFSVINTINIFFPLLKNSHKKLIINILGGGVGWHNLSKYKSPYITSKFALAGLTECLAKEFEKDDLTILGIFPGPMDSKLRNKLLDKNKVCEKNQDLSGNSTVNLIECILKINFKELTGKLLSSRFDKIENTKKSGSLFTLRRIDNKTYYF